MQLARTEVTHLFSVSLLRVEVVEGLEMEMVTLVVLVAVAVGLMALVVLELLGKAMLVGWLMIITVLEVVVVLVLWV
jgi:uncharacterized membrane protein